MHEINLISTFRRLLYGSPVPKTNEPNEAHTKIKNPNKYFLLVLEIEPNTLT